MAMGLLQMLLTIIIMIINGRFFVSGFKSLWHRRPIWTPWWRWARLRLLGTALTRCLP